MEFLGIEFLELVKSLNDTYWDLSDAKASKSHKMQNLVVNLGFAVNAINNELSMEERAKLNEKSID